MFKKISIFIICSLFVTFVNAAQAEDEKNIRKWFSKSLPSLKIDKISKSPIDGLYQVISGPVVMYATNDGHYAISGDILDLHDGETNITDSARKQARLDAINKIGEDNMVIYTPPKVKHTVTVFTDIDCSYCRKFHAQMDDLLAEGIRVRYLAFPRTGKDSRSFDKAVWVWCSKDKQTAMTDAKLGKPLKEETCQNHKIEAMFNLGALAGVSGTPTMILDDGAMLPGYYPADKLAKILEMAKKENVAAKKKNSKTQ